MSMKYLHFITIFVAFISGCQSANRENSRIATGTPTSQNGNHKVEAKGPMMEIRENTADFGTVHRNKTKKIELIFNFSNTGDLPLLISHAAVTCGCISIDYTDEPVMPGNEGTIRVFVDISNQKGYFDKTIFIESNAVNDTVVLHIKGSIK